MASSFARPQFRQRDSFPFAHRRFDFRDVHLRFCGQPAGNRRRNCAPCAASAIGPRGFARVVRRQGQLPIAKMVVQARNSLAAARALFSG